MCVFVSLYIRPHTGTNYSSFPTSQITEIMNTSMGGGSESQDCKINCVYVYDFSSDLATYNVSTVVSRHSNARLPVAHTSLLPL